MSKSKVFQVKVFVSGKKNDKKILDITTAKDFVNRELQGDEMGTAKAKIDGKKISFSPKKLNKQKVTKVNLKKTYQVCAPLNDGHTVLILEEKKPGMVYHIFKTLRDNRLSVMKTAIQKENSTIQFIGDFDQHDPADNSGNTESEPSNRGKNGNESTHRSAQNSSNNGKKNNRSDQSQKHMCSKCAFKENPNISTSFACYDRKGSNLHLLPVGNNACSLRSSYNDIAPCFRSSCSMSSDSIYADMKHCNIKSHPLRRTGSFQRQDPKTASIHHSRSRMGDRSSSQYAWRHDDGRQRAYYPVEVGGSRNGYRERMPSKNITPFLNRLSKNRQCSYNEIPSSSSSMNSLSDGSISDSSDLSIRSRRIEYLMRELSRPGRIRTG